MQTPQLVSKMKKLSSLKFEAMLFDDPNCYKCSTFPSVHIPIALRLECYKQNGFSKMLKTPMLTSKTLTKASLAHKFLPITQFPTRLFSNVQVILFSDLILLATLHRLYAALKVAHYHGTLYVCF